MGSAITVVAAGYSGTPLPKKLGIKLGHQVLISGAPKGFRLEPLPEAVSLDTRPGADLYDVIVAFCPDVATLHRLFEPLKSRLAPASALWVAWLKQASGIATDLTDGAVRAYGLEHGLVDVKVCAIDAQWSGLKFVYRVADRPTVSKTQA